MDRLLWDETRRSGGANNLERVLKKHIARQPEMRTDAISGRWIDPASNSGMIFTTFDQRVICSYRRNDAMSYCRTNAFSVDPCTRVLYVYASEYGHQSERRTSGNSCTPSRNMLLLSYWAHCIRPVLGLAIRRTRIYGGCIFYT